MTTSDVPTYLKKRSKLLKELLGTKQCCKSSYTILEGPLDERCDECVKTKKMLLSPNQDLSLDEKHRQRGEVNFSQWMKMAKGHNGFS
jgi:hypothetical protein